ncbi:hypothetical protein M0R45_000993 [Rubus argutus]|uniref:Uncharacterized protein n=1 Tax=Rubus argutus TaxID=59490 RepID=A0AAW1VNJ0_RUBAR
MTLSPGGTTRNFSKQSGSRKVLLKLLTTTWLHFYPLEGLNFATIDAKIALSMILQRYSSRCLQVMFAPRPMRHIYSTLPTAWSSSNARLTESLWTEDSSLQLLVNLSVTD